LNRSSDGDHERHKTLMDTGDMYLVTGTQTGNSPLLVQPLFREMI